MTHEKGHTLDLVLSCGLYVSVCETACISDHLPVLFNVDPLLKGQKLYAPTHRRCIITPQTALQFAALFN